MRSPIPLRRRAVFWLLLPAVPLLVIVARLSASPSPVPGYWTWTVAHSILLILVPGAVASAGAALDAARLRARRAENTLTVRAPARVILDALWPSFVCGLLLQGVAVAIAAMEAWGGSSGIPWALIGAIAAMIFLHTALGFACGSILRPLFAIPVALAASYVWLGFTGTIEYFPLRHLAGLVLETCCSYDRELSLESAASVSVFSALAGIALLLLSASALRLTRGPYPFIAAAAVVAVAFAAGLLIARELGPVASNERDPDDLVCADGAVTVCLFPEQVDGDVFARVQLMVQRVIDAGVPLATTVVASSDDEANAERIRFAYRPGMTDQEVAGSLASDVPAGMCANDDAETVNARDTVWYLTIAWLEGTMLGDAGSDGDSFPELDRLRGLTPLEQATWVNQGIHSMRDCAIPLPSVP